MDVLGKISTQVAVNLDMPVQVVQHVKRIYEEIFEVCRDYKGKGTNTQFW
ncbi:hypothetical protein L218DRAFT_878041 [Marasmius fiardii PR-910]|nr:hypothetical protein L218DRAFT_878041 [Marasmius fiardii PR-910]